MAKMHWYEDDEAVQEELLPFEEKERVMLKRALESIEDLLAEEARCDGTRLSIQQKQEMEAIIADANVQGLRS